MSAGVRPKRKEQKRRRAYADRKMCVCNTNAYLGKGTRCAFPLHPSGKSPRTNSPLPPSNSTRLTLGGIALGQGENERGDATIGRCITSQGSFLLPDTP